MAQPRIEQVTSAGLGPDCTQVLQVRTIRHQAVSASTLSPIGQPLFLRLGNGKNECDERIQ
jgi:hypothetical protein